MIDPDSIQKAEFRWRELGPISWVEVPPPPHFVAVLQRMIQQRGLDIRSIRAGMSVCGERVRIDVTITGRAWCRAEFSRPRSAREAREVFAAKAHQAFDALIRVRRAAGVEE